MCIDITRLRKIAAVRGLVNDGLRTRVWPLLLGVDQQVHDAAAYEQAHREPHADSHVVKCDMERSLWSFTEGWEEADREERRAALRRVLDAAGLHDIAAVLLFVCGERLAFRMLAALATCHLRDCTRRDLAAATEMLRLLYAILEACDPGLYAYIQGLQEPALETPYFALSWYMTWFAHDVRSLPQAARLFDLFLSSHPLMPLYLAAVAIKASAGLSSAGPSARGGTAQWGQDGGGDGGVVGEWAGPSCRARILDCGDDGLEVYGCLKRLQILGPGQPSADELAREAAALYRAVPPAALMRRKGIRLEQSVAVHAYLAGGRWRVPARPRDPPLAARIAAQTVQQLQGLFAARRGASPAGARKPGRRPTLVAVLASMTGVAALGAAVLLAQMPQMQAWQPWNQ
eukprot:scaffold6.g2678.t1